MKTAFRFTVIVLFALASAAAALATTQKAPSSGKPGYSPAMQTVVKNMQAKISQQKREEAIVKKHLKTFDTLDFVVFSNQEWTRLHESHSKDVIVDWPDGHHTNGIDRHIKDLKALFVPAPDTKIKVHPIRFGAYRGVTGSSISPNGQITERRSAGDEGFTCVTGIMTGTFTKPMPIGNGKFIQPTGKKFSVPMCTVGHWKNGVMVEEWLYWDNATYMKQIGLGK